MEPPGYIAKVAVVYVYPDGRRVPGNIWVGTPEQVDDVEARCLVGADGLESVSHRIAGGDTLQALLLALRFMAARLAAFEEGGGSIEYPTGEVVELGAYFGNLVKNRT